MLTSLRVLGAAATLILALAACAQSRPPGPDEGRTTVNGGSSTSRGPFELHGEDYDVTWTVVDPIAGCLLVLRLTNFDPAVFGATLVDTKADEHGSALFGTAQVVGLDRGRYLVDARRSSCGEWTATFTRTRLASRSPAR